MNEARDKLGTMATEINVRLGKAENYDGRAELALQKADDHRLAAALQLAEARAVADDHRIGWKLWVDKNIERSYRDVKRLVAIGSAKDPVLALEGARRRDRDAKARSRDQGGGVIGDRAPGHPPGQQPAIQDNAPPQHNSEVEDIQARLDRLPAADVQALVSHIIRNLLTDAQQRKLAKGLAGDGAEAGHDNDRLRVRPRLFRHPGATSSGRRRPSNARQPRRLAAPRRVRPYLRTRGRSHRPR